VSFGIGNLLTRVPESEEEPMEVTIDPPDTPALEPKQEAESADSSAAGGSGNEGGSVAAGGGGGTQPLRLCLINSDRSVVAIGEKQPTAPPSPAQATKPVQTPLPQVATEPKPITLTWSIASQTSTNLPTRCSQSASTNAK